MTFTVVIYKLMLKTFVLRNLCNHLSACKTLQQSSQRKVEGCQRKYHYFSRVLLCAWNAKFYCNSTTLPSLQQLHLMVHGAMSPFFFFVWISLVDHHRIIASDFGIDHNRGGEVMTFLLFCSASHICFSKTLFCVALGPPARKWSRQSKRIWLQTGNDFR